MSLFLQAFTYAMHSEGGYSNHPDDRGGETKYGITAATARRHGLLGVANLSLTDAMDIYYKDYWNVIEPIAKISPRIGIKMFDTHIVCRPRVAIRLLQRSLSDLGYHAAEDGIWGLETLGALRRALEEKGEDSILHQYVNELVSHFSQIAQANPTQKVFLKGWLNRARRLPMPLQPEQNED